MIRVGIAQHQAQNVGGIATYARGLVHGLGVVPTADIRVEPIGATQRAQNAATRLAWEQFRLPAAGRHVDILHMTDFRVPVQRSTPVVATVHDVSFITHPNCLTRMRRAYKRIAFDLMLARKPELIACDSAYTLAALSEVAPSVASRCALLVPGVRPPDRVLTRAPEPDLILTVGLTGARKNLETFRRAFEQARRAGLALRWVAVGPPGPEDDELLERLRSTAGVTVVGHIGDAELERYWSSAALIAVPSLLEGFSYPVIEAMQRGVPVIASRGSALDETADHVAWRVEATDVDGWTDALLRLSRDSAELERLAAAGRSHAADYTWELRAPAFVEAYRSLVS